MVNLHDYEGGTNRSKPRIGVQEICRLKTTPSTLRLSYNVIPRKFLTMIEKEISVLMYSYLGPGPQQHNACEI